MPSLFKSDFNILLLFKHIKMYLDKISFLKENFYRMTIKPVLHEQK